VAVTIPKGYILRQPAPDEAPAIQAVLDAAESADAGEVRCKGELVGGGCG
jgi:hypothetical protein